LSVAAEKPEIESSSGRVTGIEGMEEAVVKIGQDLRVVEGLIVRLICPVSRGFPTPQVTWFLNDRLVQSSERFLIDRRSNSLILNGIDLEDTGQVSCVANNSAGQASESSFISILGKDPSTVGHSTWGRVGAQMVMDVFGDNTSIFSYLFLI